MIRCEWTFVCPMESFYYVIDERKMRFQTPIHAQCTLNRYQLSQRCIEHTSLICHTTQFTCLRKEFPILIFAYTSLKRSYTHARGSKNKRAFCSGAIFRWNILRHYYCFTHFREHVSDSANNLVKHRAAKSKEYTTKKFWIEDACRRPFSLGFFYFASATGPKYTISACLLSRNQCQNDESLSPATGKILVMPAISCVCVSCIIEFSAFVRVPLL